MSIMTNQRHQGRIHRLHFTVSAPLPHGTTLRVTSTIRPPPSNHETAAINDNHDDADDRSLQVFQSYDTAESTTTANGGNLNDHSQNYNRLLRNTVELFTTPETYPIWKTERPVVIVDDGIVTDKAEGKTSSSSSSSLLRHHYRYVAVTPGATIDWTFLDTIKSENDNGDGEDGMMVELPPVLYENPADFPNDNNNASTTTTTAGEASSEGGKKKGHERFPSVFDAMGNPVQLPPTSSSYEDDTELTEPISAPVSTASFSSFVSGEQQRQRNAVMTPEQISALPYRTRVLNNHDNPNDADDEEVIVDTWNCASDPSFQLYWDSIKNTNDVEDVVMTEKTLTSDTATDSKHQENEDDDPMDATDSAGRRESIYIVCYHLPVILSKNSATNEWTACWSESLIAKSEIQSITSTRQTYWVGTVSNIPQELLKDENEQRAIRAVLRGMDCIPVFFTDAKYESVIEFMYLGFCKQVLWPSFHNVDLLDLATNGWGQRQRNTRADPVQACALAAAEASERKRSGSFNAPPSPGGRGDGGEKLKSDWDQRRLDKWWTAYQTVNSTFTEIVASLVSGSDIVWVHDYHLALLPHMLREARHENVATDLTANQSNKVEPVKIVMFFHVPFPTSQVFRELEHGERLLEGVLGADVIGFHAFDHARHFLNAAKRILGLSHESLVGGLIGVRYRGTKVVVTISNVSVETDIMDALLEFPSVKEDAAALQKKHDGKTIIAGIDVAQRLSGVSLKLLAFERLLTDYPVWQPKVVLLQRCLIPGNRRVDEADTLREVRALVQRIKARFGEEVIDYEEQVGSVLPIDQRLAIWTSSQVMMHMPVREGLNLCPLEFVYARKEPATPGVVIASEFSAVSSILNGALRVNPWDVQMSVSIIDSALSMSSDERDARRGRDIDFVSNSPSGMWTRNVLRDLNDATQKDPSNREALLGNPAESLDMLAIEKLELRSLESAYKMSKRRVIIIDFNGTLVVKEPPTKYLKREILGTSGFKPSAIASKALGKLCQDPNNVVYVVSGDTQPNLEAAVGDIAGLGLAASNGACFADPGSQGKWTYLNFGVDWQAVQKTAMPIISKFTARTNGSFVKLTHSSIGWSYYSCDPEWGSIQSTHLVKELTEALAEFDVRFVALKGIVEVVPRKLNKGHIVKRILDDVNAQTGDVDFVLCMGDDIADEKMFTSVAKFSAENQNTFAFNVAVGKKPTNASFYVDDASSVTDVLVNLSGEQPLQRKESVGSGASDDFFS